MPTYAHAFLLLMLSCSLLSCKRSTPSLSDPEAYRHHISSYTQGVISSSSPILIAFAQPYGEQSSAKKVTSDILQFSPEIKGSTEWLDAHTLRFVPAERLPNGTDYVGTLALHHLVNGLSVDLRSFSFAFSTRQQFAELWIDGLYIPEPGKSDLYQLTGEIRTNDFAVPEDIKKTLQLTGLPKNPPVTWTHHEENTLHRFTIFPIPGIETARQLVLQFRGRAIQSHENMKMDIVVPAADDFFVMKADLARDSRNRIDILFSQIIQPGQDLAGLIYLSNQAAIEPRLVVDGNRVQCHFPEHLRGPAQLFVDGAIRDGRGNKMGQPFSKEVHFTQAAPAIRLVGKGHILPDAENLLFPFEAINLHSVEVEVFKIFNNNILQFLQVNRLEGSNDLHRVGRIVWRGRVDLRKLNPQRNNREYIRYALDLAHLIKPDPGAIYQIRIGYWSNCTDYQCADASDSGSPTPDAGADAFEDDDYYGDYYYGYRNEEEEESFLNAWYGERGYTRDYRWEHRNNPCRPEYYHSGRFVSRNVIASNLGITIKSAPDQTYMAAVHDLRTALPIAQAEVTYLDYQLQPILKTETQRNGIAWSKLPRTPHIALVNKGNASGYATLVEYQSLKVADFDTDGVTVSDGMRAFIYGERGVWRPGDSIYLQCILYQPDGHAGREPHPVTMTLFDPRGREVMRSVNHQPTGPLYPFHFATAEDAPTGAWHARFEVGNATFHKYLRVETVKPNRYKLQLQQESKGTTNRTPSPLHFRLQAQWLHGAVVSNQPVQVDLHAISIPTRFKPFEKFRFDHFGKLDLSWSPVMGQPTDTQGNLKFDVDTAPFADAPGRMRLHLKYRVQEPGGGFSQDFQSLDYDPYTSYCGLQVPLNAQKRPVYEIMDMQDLQFAAVSPDGKPLSNRSLRVRISEHTWRWWWERYRNNYTAPNSAEFVREVVTQTVKTDVNGLASWSYAFAQYGRYVIEVCDPLTGHCASQEVYVYDQKQSDQRSSELQYFELETDKKVYVPGEKAHFSLPAVPGGHALITLESGRTIIEAWTVPLSHQPRKESFAITAAMVPNLYLSVSLFQPHDIQRSDLPLRLYSICPITVEYPRSRLQPVMKAPREMRPDKTYNLTVSEKSGRAMAYTLALVDEGLLDLTRFGTPDPHQSLFSKEALGVKSWDVYDEVMGGFAGELKRIAAIGGDGGAAAVKGSPKARRFPPALVHLGPFWLPAGRSATHTVQLPNYMGSVRAMVIGASSEAFGSADQTIAVRKPLMVAATLPRTLGIGESLDITATVFVSDESIRRVNLEIQDPSGLLQFTQGNTTAIQVSGKGEYTVHFPATAGQKTGISQPLFKASDGKETASHRLEIDVRNPNPVQTRTVERMLHPGESFTFNEPLTGTPGTNSATLYAFGIPPIQLDDKIRQLVAYPFGCLEQTASRVFPLLFLPDVVDLTPEKRKFYRQLTEQGIQRILSLLTAEGRLQFWPSGAHYHEWSEIWAMACLIQAKAAGYPVPQNNLNAIINYQKRRANQWTAPTEANQSVTAWNAKQQAWRLYALAMAGEAPAGAQNRLREYAGRSELDTWLLAAAYARAGKLETARQLTQNLNTAVSDYHDMHYSYGSELRDLGLIGIALLEMGDRERAFRVIRQIAERMNSNRWYSTHSLATGLWAYTMFGRSAGTSDPVHIRYATSDGAGEQLSTPKTLLQKTLPPAVINQKPLRVENMGQEIVYVQLALAGQPAPGREEAVSKGLRFDVSYEGGTKYRNLAVGTDFTATVKVWHAGAGQATIPEVALSQLLPSGWEIRNVRIEGEGPPASAHTPYRYRDIRDDRAYTFFDVYKQQDPQVFVLHLSAAYPGRYYLPGQKIEAMYSPDHVATTVGEWITVYDPSRKR